MTVLTYNIVRYIQLKSLNIILTIHMPINFMYIRKGFLVHFMSREVNFDTLNYSNYNTTRGRFPFGMSKSRSKHL